MHLYSDRLDEICRALLAGGWRFTVNGPTEQVYVIAWWSTEKPHYTVKDRPL